MPRYVAFLRGVSPMNAKMPELKRTFEGAGFTNVKTVLASGNVVFDASAKAEATLARQAENAMQENLDRTFMTIVRSVESLRALIDADPYSAFKLPPKSKHVITFLRQPYTSTLSLPIKSGDARILAIRGQEVLTSYVPHPGSPEFMRLLEKTFGKDITTRTLDTVKKCATA
ncbi:DUF1697 domain-containing protein [Steroidobacter sp. S1-65]|uniref:DUF1697 domain-containing protein n=1 Tax=Steroidobacter gossypii TaxID=2805490 RepID=A0ABS1WTV1_9GAMM|nr:DUF1697 domain-containing protein [Steroidobacter gossypii]MBM0104372.1 DUF1697 domain-containing protein [Steroidobacter gossypii]